MGKTRRRIRLQNRPLSWKMIEWASSLNRFEPIARRFYLNDSLNVSCIPVNEDLVLPENTVLPFQVVVDFISRSSHRVVVDVCNCREANSCKRYPTDIGCLFMGKAALEIHPSVGHEVSVDGALEHAEAAVEKGLVPTIGKSWLDNVYFGIKNRKQLLSLCFCCDCCCIQRFSRYVHPRLRNQSIHRLEGLRIEVGPSCEGCGTCVTRCLVGSLSVEDGHAVIGSGCIGCGRCATACPQDAITLSLDDPDFLDEVRERIESVVDIS